MGIGKKLLFLFCDLESFLFHPADGCQEGMTREKEEGGCKTGEAI
jgi:hypothetical protein